MEVFWGIFKGLAKSFGMGGLSSAPTYNIPDIIKSRRLKKDIVLKNWKSQKFPQGSNLITYWEIDKTKIFSPIKIIRSLIPTGTKTSNKLDLYTHESILKLNDLISVKEEISGLITCQGPNGRPHASFKYFKLYCRICERLFLLNKKGRQMKI